MCDRDEETIKEEKNDEKIVLRQTGYSPGPPVCRPVIYGDVPFVGGRSGLTQRSVPADYATKMMATTTATHVVASKSIFARGIPFAR